MVDARLHRRRVEVRRQEGRRRLRVLLGVTGVLAFGGAGWAANGSTLLDIDRVVVLDVVHTAPDEASVVSGLRRGDPLSGVDQASVARRVETLPWVEAAVVSRRWPGEVRIRVVERRAVAVAPADDGSSALVDGTGRVLEWVPAPPAELAALAGLPPAGPPGSPLAPEGVAVLSVAVALPVELRGRTAGVAPAPGGRGEVDLRLSPEGMVRLGPPDDLDRKFEAIRTVLAQVDVRNLAVLDVRRPESPVLTRRETPTKVSTPRVG